MLIYNHYQFIKIKYIKIGRVYKINYINKYQYILIFKIGYRIKILWYGEKSRVSYIRKLKTKWIIVGFRRIFR